MGVLYKHRILKQGGEEMAIDITNHKCPACTGPLQFDGASGKLKCEYCDSSFQVEEIEAMYEEKDENVKISKKSDKQYSDNLSKCKKC